MISGRDVLTDWKRLKSMPRNEPTLIMSGTSTRWTITSSDRCTSGADPPALIVLVDHFRASRVLMNYSDHVQLDKRALTCSSVRLHDSSCQWHQIDSMKCFTIMTFVLSRFSRWFVRNVVPTIAQGVVMPFQIVPVGWSLNIPRIITGLSITDLCCKLLLTFPTFGELGGFGSSVCCSS